MTRFLLGFFSFGWLQRFDFLPPLLLRLFLAPLLWVSGSNKLALFSADSSVWYNILSWTNTENPYFKASTEALAKLPFVGDVLAPVLTLSIGWLEVVGALLLFIGFAVRWLALPLLALALLTAVMAFNGESLLLALQQFAASHGYQTIAGTPFNQALIVFLMLLTLFFMGAGRYFSVDWFLHRKLQRRIAAQTTKRQAKKEKRDPFELDNTTD